ncbi:hypothetical protein RFM23_05445 [Mesorhizobium abyssinicae]|uniref:Ubiquitin-activating enzyme E1 FCCH domain-containing protein n=1 Tax=Mesorhizobium abyssinicae TaxID=1209958 RepID=A0ABU5AIG9_9HYPH|nr:hypothetical protein [Mesorhizobium abyssinicae]MDX8537067.1 hypothetical protein [Mesorhizobium abyssinicae]
MSVLRALQPSFTAGVLSPSLWARVDLAKYATGLKKALNLFVHPHGGISNRAGTEFIREVKASANKTWLIPFQFNTEQSYQLEFGNLYFRVFKNGALVLTGGGSPYECVTPYASADVDALVFVQEADVMYIVHPTYPVQKLERLADNNWQLVAVTFAPATTAPTGLAGTVIFKRNRGDSDTMDWRVTAVGPTNAESAASAVTQEFVQYQNDDGRKIRIAWNAVVGASFYRVYRTDTNIGVLVETANTTVDILQQQYQGDGTAYPTVADPGAPATPTGVTSTTIYGEDSKYVVSAVDATTGEESLPSAPITLTNDMSYKGNRNELTWNAVAGAGSYIIYREDNGLYGYIGTSETTSFTDENVTADLSDGPQEARNPFVGVGNYPRAVTFIEQRLGMFGTNNDPQAAWLSQSANYENFGVASPAKASDAVTFRIRSRQVNEIRAALAIKGLMLLTSGSEWIVSGGANSDAITPSAIKVDNQGYRGAAKVQPVIVGNTVLFAQDRGCVIRDFSYEFAQDNFTGKDLTILARHLFENKAIKSWAYAQAPYSMVWVVLDDGSLVSLTYLKEHDIWAWTHHESGPDDDAVFECVSVIAEGKEDVPYFIVKRTIDGVSKRYVERLHSRAFTSVEDAFFVDCGLTYSGAAATVISGLSHLKGQSVVALANGNVVRNLTVSNTGTVTLPNEATKAHIGLPMTAALQTLDLDLGSIQGLGTVQGRKKSFDEVTLRVQDTRGIFLGPKDAGRDDPNALVEYKQRQDEAWNEAIGMYTGDIHITPHWDWSDGGNVWVKQFDPLPMTILALMPNVTIGR